MTTGMGVNQFSTGIAIGMLFGTGIGCSTGNLALGICFGMALGVLFGLCRNGKSGKQEK